MSEHIYDDSIECAFVNDTKRERIVRCRDCKHYEDYTGCCTRRDCVAPMAVTAGGFCAWGERREVE